MYIIKYGVSTLSEANKDGTDLMVDAFSDSLGGTTSVEVVDRDIIGELTTVGSQLVVQFWQVVDGAEWFAFNPCVAPGELMMSHGGTLDYQNGALFALDDVGSVFSPMIGVITDIADRIANP